MISQLKMNRKALQKEAGMMLRIGGPVIIAQLLQMSMNFVDTVMAGNLSADALAAVAVGGAVYMPLVMLAAGILMAVNPIVAQLLGARKFEEIGINARQGLWLSQLLAVPLFFIIRNLDVVMHLIHVTPSIIPVALGYVNALSWGLFPLLAYVALRYFNEGLSITRPGMYIAAVGVIVNVIGNYIFMYGACGLRGLGAIGCGYASSLVGLVMFICLLLFVMNHQPFQRFRIFDDIRQPDWSYLKQMLQLGIPIGLSSAMEVTMFAVISLLMGSLSAVAVAGHQIAINFSAMTFMVPFGLSTAVTARVGQAAGRQNTEQVRSRGMIGITLAVAFMCFTALLMATVPDLITAMYTNNSGVQSVAISLLYMAAIFQISDGLQVSGYGALRGIKDTKIPMIVNLIAYWLIGLPLGYYLGIIRGVGPQGLWIGLIAGLSIAAILHNTRFWLKTRS